MALVVATLVPDTPDEVPQASGSFDVLEVRLDHLEPSQAREAVEAAQRPVLAACRRAEDGGENDLAGSERRERLLAALDAGAALVDVERDADFREELAHQARRRQATTIVSDHLDHTPPSDAALKRLFKMAPDADVVKLATQPDTPRDVHALVDLALTARDLGTPFTVMGLGDATLRGLAAPLGMALVYAGLDDSVPGQLPADLQARLPTQPAQPSPGEDYVLLGHPVDHSLSPRMQHAAFDRLDADATYRLVDVAPDHLDGVLDMLRRTADGGNATSPHKRALFEACDRITDTASACEAANTFRVEDDQLHGHMTDGLGAIDALRHADERVDGRRSLVIGAGGTARAIAHALAGRGAKVAIANRTADKAQRLAKRVDGDAIAFEEAAIADWATPDALVVNATPVDPPVPDDALAHATAFDCNYGHRARLAHRAMQLGTDPITGLELLVHQGVRSLAFWREVPDDVPLVGPMRTAAKTGALERRHGGDH
jgi:shikimate dehydrogenase/3-dehydroquinate dehydratase type I